MTDRCFVMLKPMRAGLSGYARIQAEAGGATVFISARGLGVGRATAYWYNGGVARALATSRVNPRGEALFEARLPDGIPAPERLQALFIIGEGDKPLPLLIGLCTRQSAGSLMDAKNAMLALCERIEKARVRGGDAAGDGNTAASPSNSGISARDASSDADIGINTVDSAASADGSDTANTADGDSTTAYPTPQIPDEPLSQADEPAPLTAALSVGADCVRPRLLARAVRVKPRAIEPPREIFLTAIDPRPYIIAEDAPSPPEDDIKPPSPPESSAAIVTPRCQAAATSPPFVAPRFPRAAAARPVDALPALRCPAGFAALNARFDELPPVNPLGLKGWRFVCLDMAHTLYVGRQTADGRVVRFVYAFRGNRPPDGDKPYRRARGADGDSFYTLVQRV